MYFFLTSYNKFEEDTDYGMRSLIYINYAGYVYLNNITTSNNFLFDPYYNSQRAVFLFMESFVGQADFLDVSFDSYSGFYNTYTSSFLN
jgi:hypothetical protein